MNKYEVINTATIRALRAEVEELDAAQKRIKELEAAITEVVDGSLIDDFNRNDDGMMDAVWQKSAQERLETWIHTLKQAIALKEL